jgi:hypothetical protein
MAIPPEVYAPLPVDPASSKVLAATFWIVHFPLAAVLPPTFEMVTTSPFAKPCAVLVTTIGEAFVAPVIALP